MMNSGSASVSRVISGGEHAFSEVLLQESILEAIANLVVNDRLRPAATTRPTGLAAETMRTGHELLGRLGRLARSLSQGIEL
jgi:hypothetical protein